MKLYSLLLCLSLILFHTCSSLAKRGGSSGGSSGGSRGGGWAGGFFGKPRGSAINNSPVNPLPSYPRQNMYPAAGAPYGGGYGGNPGANPQFGGGYGPHSVQSMGRYPVDKSRGFGAGSAMSAAGGAMAGMALGSALGSFPRPPFPIPNPLEQYFYNLYLDRRYGVRSPDGDDIGKGDRYKQHIPFDPFMDSCMKRPDLLPVENREPGNKPAITATASTKTDVVPSAPIETNSTAAENSTSSPQPEDGKDKQISYPSVSEQIKARRCLELYMVDSEKFLNRQRGGAQGLGMGLPGLLAVVTTGTVLMLLNSNVLTL